MLAALLPFGAGFQQTQTLESLKEDTVQILRRAQFNAMTGERDRAWGVKFLATEYVLFAGDSYATRDSTYDEVHPIQPEFSFSGLTEVPFREVSGEVGVAGITTITHAQGGTRTVTVNDVGGVFP